MACSYKRRDRFFEAQIAKRAGELRARREAEQLAEIVRELQDKLIPLVVHGCGEVKTGRDVE